MRAPTRLKILWSDLEALAAEHNLAWRKQITKDKWGAPVSFEDFPNPPHAVQYQLDHAGYFRNGEKIWVHGIMKLRRGRYYLCKV